MFRPQGIIHRDLKGNNIFCCANGILKLGDFGISKVLTPDARAARTMIGTPYYMSPVRPLPSSMYFHTKSGQRHSPGCVKLPKPHFLRSAMRICIH